MCESIRVALFGAGRMGSEYRRVLEHLSVPHKVFARHRVAQGGVSGTPMVEDVKDFLEGRITGFTHAIVATPVEGMSLVAESAVKGGIKKILLEKPGGLYPYQLRRLQKEASKQTADIRIAYNRRFYSSVSRLRTLVQQDGGLTSLHFEFGEGGPEFNSQLWPTPVAERWMLYNSSHVFDLVTYLGGQVADQETIRSGDLPWHPSGSFFAGFGRFSSGIPFTYRSDWGSFDRWLLRVNTPKRSFQLCPLETLEGKEGFKQAFRPMLLEDEMDRSFKPGIHEMVSKFLHGNLEDFPTVKHQMDLFRWISAVGGYGDSSK